MMRMIILLVFTVSIAVSIPAASFAQPPMNCIPPEEGMSGDDKAYIASGLVLTGINLALTRFNSARTGSGDASGGGMMGGMAFGLLGVGFGTAIMYSDEDPVKVTGVACVLAGAVSFVYGLKAGEAVNRRKKERQGLAPVFEPVIVTYGRGKTAAGLQVSWDF